jgi:hypothetical protein
LCARSTEHGAPVSNRGVGRQVTYEATVKGLRAFDDWLRSIPDECFLRDDVQFKLAVARPDDLPLIIELIRDSELVCAAREQALEHSRPANPKDRSVWHSALNDVAGDAELMFWHTRTRWLEGVRETLEEVSAGVAR